MPILQQDILNNYGKNEKKYYDKKSNLYGGIKLPYSNVLLYERAKGKIIVLSGFILASKEHKIAENFSGRKNTRTLYNLENRFSVILFIKNYYNKKRIPNGVKIEDLSQNKKEKTILFLPYSFFYVRDVQIDHINFKADIYLENIGKKEILEEQIKIRKEIKYNKNEKIMEAQ